MSKVIATSVTLSYGPRTVLDNLSMAIDAGSMTLLAGRNGAGKSTLLNVLAGIRQPASGETLLDGRAIGDYPGRERARKVTLIPQEADSPFEFTGRELVMMGRYPYVHRFRGAQPEDHAAVQRALDLTDGASFADRSVHTLSGGEMRRISIARALATEAEVLLADEPTSDLDLEHAVAILTLLHRLADEGRTVLIASHDLNLIAPRCDRVALLHDGRITHEGEPEDVLVIEYQLTLSLAIQATRSDGTEVLVDPRALRETERYLVSPDVEATRKNRDEALHRVAAQLAGRVHDALAEVLTP